MNKPDLASLPIRTPVSRLHDTKRNPINSPISINYCFAYLIVKILWAPIVDSVYIKSFGRRKSWLVPVQVVLGMFMLYVAQNVDEWMGNGTSKDSQMVVLTSAFFVMWFLAATQDVAVDGWALTMLKREHVGFAATCNAGILVFVAFNFTSS